MLFLPYFAGKLFLLMVLTFKSVDKTLVGGHWNEIYRVVLFMMLYKVVQTF